MSGDYSSSGDFAYSTQGAFNVSASAPSIISGPSLLSLLAPATSSPYASLPQALDTSGSGTLLLWYFTSDFLASGTGIDDNYEIEGEGTFYGEFGYAFCFSQDCFTAPAWSLEPGFGFSSPSSGQWAAPAPAPGAQKGGLYLLVLTTAVVDPTVRLKDAVVGEPIVEPASALLLAGGLAGMWLRRRRRLEPG